MADNQNQKRTKKVNLISLGCPKNLVDSEKILGSLGAAGIIVTSSPSQSDVLVINTCGFIKPALDETENEIKRALQLKNKKIYVFGCAVNRYKKELIKKYPKVSGWFRLAERNELISTICPHALRKKSRLVTTRGYAYLKIAEGCSNHCSYCTIPSIKGEFRSFDFDALIKEANELTKLGIKEIILIGQDTTRYGIDIYEKPTLALLLKELSKIKNIEWLRILYAHPKTITEEIIDELATNPKVCKYLDLPIQHINNRILKLMNRGVDRKRIETIIKKLKKIEGISLRTTVIVGFPGETEDEFNELVQFLKQRNFDWLGVFPYFCESKTPAAKLAQLPESLVEKRYQEITQLQKDLIKFNNKTRIGKVYKTLLHYNNNGNYIGHTEFAAPKIDGQVIAKSPKLMPGNFYNVKIAKTRGADLYGYTDF